MDNKNSSGALRSTSAFTPARMQEVEQAKEIQLNREQVEYRELMEIASLANHPGWQRVVKIMEAAIGNYKSGKAIATVINAPQMSNARLGEEVRVCFRMAGEIESLLNMVTVKSNQYEQRRKKRATDRVRPQPTEKA